MKPTSEQEKIISESSHRVVLAKPGSGKTFTLSKIIQKELKNTPDHKGVIAISFTNKASKELEVRSISGRDGSKNSFLGTIDKFTIQEIVFPFLPHLLKKTPIKEPEIIMLQDAEGLIADFDNFSLECGKKSEASEAFISTCTSLFHQGYLILESCPKLALYVFDNSKACKNYFKARYTHIIIDEYQDSGWEQYSLFMRLKNLGLIAIAVGDLDQSIYYFTGKEPSYLASLAEEDDFKTFNLPKNHRSHPSIVNYSLTFISKNPQLLPCSETRVFYRNVQGTQKEIAPWIAKLISSIEKKGHVEERNEVGILVRSNYSAAIIKDHIGLPVKYFIETKIDTDTNPWSQLFRNLLFTIHENNSSSFDFSETYISESLEPRKFIKVLKMVKSLKEKYKAQGIKYLSTDEFVKIAKETLPSKENLKSVKLLEEVIKDEELFYSYRPAQPDEVQLMTLHKSKGLEFTVVFHIDLYDYILPSYSALQGNKTELLQDKNLHYVGITRAKEYSVLVSSTQRINGSGQIKSGAASKFLHDPKLKSLRS